ncbi:ricin-type beta-trefoil lectin domain protein [Actinoplanes sp. NBRC 103695]|uniref:ricin-type beta-trefoil lectin domain protein n=1 Tax=Actinoplanes sp. NBRC 103695 TaxID=3032202 RepID=UPI0024A54EF5|nr:ricin-type beta-trefoil lectin domain protein [Actinoplanes sp. NBRC 103695]GLY97804.1 hypothetical protein Acsp02_50580 [Actinoplanes sp. NBRC 103695]
MTDLEQGDGSEPLLVRRYLHSPVRAAATTHADVRWPAAAYSAATTSTVAPPQEPVHFVAAPAIYGSPPPKRRRGVVLAAAGAVAAAGLATAGYVVFAPSEPGDRIVGALPQAAPSTSPPAGALAEPDASGDDAPTGETTQPAAPDDAAPGDSAEQGDDTGPASPRQGTSTTTPATPGSPAGAAPGRPTSATPTQQTKAPLLLAPPPAAAAPVARTGRIVADDGRCLDLFANNPADGNRVQVFTCNGTPAQNFTLATDGTLRVRDKCADVTRRAAVRITGCGDRDVTHWRIGSNGTLTSASSGRCLTRPPAGRESVQTSQCSGSATQRWTLPG